MASSKLIPLLFLLLAPTLSLFAQVSLPGQATPTQQPPAPTPTPVPTPTIAPDSPRASLRDYFTATRAGRWQEGARYLLLAEDQQARGAELAERLKGVLDIMDWIDLETVSAKPQGRLDDDLPPELEEVGTIRFEDRDEPLRLVRTSDARGTFWAFSSSTVARIDDWYAKLPSRWLRDLLISAGLDRLLRPGPHELLWWQWIALPFVVLIAWAAGPGLAILVKLLRRRFRPQSTTIRRNKLMATAGPPLILTWSIVVFSFGLSLLQPTAPAMNFLAHIIAAAILFVFYWALWRATGVISAWVLQMPWAYRNPSARHMLSIGNNLARGVVVVIGLISMMAALGYSVGTILAGIGIGGLALAFGAQKTIENLFGSIALAIDQPIRVGDMVKIEDFVGTSRTSGCAPLESALLTERWSAFRTVSWRISGWNLTRRATGCDWQPQSVSSTALRGVRCRQC